MIKLYMKSVAILFLCISFMTATAQTADVMRRLNNRYERVARFDEGRAAVMSRTKWGYVDTLGRAVIPLTYDRAVRFREGFAVVGRGKDETSLSGLIDRTGREVSPLKWKHLGNVYDGFAVGWVPAEGDKRSYSLIDTLGRETVVSYDFVRDFACGYAVVGEGDYREEMNPGGKTVRVFSGKYGYITSDGKLAIPIQFDEARNFGEDGLAPVGMQGKYYVKWGFADREGNIVIPCDYYSVNSFEGDLALVSKVVAAGKLAYGYIDRTGKEHIPCRYDEATSFRFPNTWVATVGPDGKSVYQLIDKAGNPVLAYPVYDLQDGGKYGHAVAAVCDASGVLRYGIVDNRGRNVLPYDYDQITIFSEWDAVNRCWNERGIAVKNGRNQSFSIGKKSNP